MASRSPTLRARLAGAIGVALAIIAGVLLHTAFTQTFGPVLVLATANLGGAMLALSSLSFIGLGVEAPQAEWGAMVSTGRGYFQTKPWVVALPGLAIGLTVLATSLLGDTLRDLADPQNGQG